jgi:predicted ArsR family transcriptional regulator
MAADNLLLRLKTHGPQRTGELAARLQVSRQAARQALERLAAEGLVTHTLESAGVGRPGQVWALTEAGHARFPDTHAQMTLELIEAARATFGEEGLDRLIAAREKAALSAYRQDTAAADLEERIQALALARAREGYMSEVQALPEGGWLLIENHCPICAAARACQGFCRSELSLFRAVLGETVSIERTDHILAGARRCAYRIQPAAPQPAAM